MNALFARIAKSVSNAVGSPLAFVVAAGAVVVWVVAGPVFGYSSSWQLVINTGTTIVTFLMVFIIQNAQNRDQKALQLKLDELLRATGEAKTGFVNLENLDDETLANLESQFERLRKLNEDDIRRDVSKGPGQVLQPSNASLSVVQLVESGDVERPHRPHL